MEGDQLFKLNHTPKIVKTKNKPPKQVHALRVITDAGKGGRRGWYIEALSPIPLRGRI